MASVTFQQLHLGSCDPRNAGTPEHNAASRLATKRGATAKTIPWLWRPVAPRPPRVPAPPVGGAEARSLTYDTAIGTASQTYAVRL